MYVTITESVYQNAIAKLEYKTHELLGIIGSSGDNCIDFFILDDNAATAAYHCMPSPNITLTLQKEVCFVGIIHSHPNGRPKISMGDVEYAKCIIRASKNLPFILMGIVCDNKLDFYRISLEDTIKLDLHIVK